MYAQSEGLPTEGGLTAKCGSSTGQVWSRSAFFDGRYGIMYAWYMPKDQILPIWPYLGHRHDVSFPQSQSLSHRPTIEQSPNLCIAVGRIHRLVRLRRHLRQSPRHLRRSSRHRPRQELLRQGRQLQTAGHASQDRLQTRWNTRFVHDK